MERAKKDGLATADSAEGSGRDGIVFKPTGPKWNRAQLEVQSSGTISEIFGPMFVPQDSHGRQCRMPQGSLLCVDRVTGVAADKGALGEGVLWSETDISPDAWYLNKGRMPPGVILEAGQAHMMLISYMGIDLVQAGDRSYRLLSGTITFHGDLPAAGETLQYEIRITGHSRLGDLRMFSFEYDCVSEGKSVLTLTGGQAGFFTRAELVSAAGVKWGPDELTARIGAQLDEPRLHCTRSEFSGEQVAAFAAGDAYDCFGPGWENAQTHTRSPSIQGDKMLLIDHVSEFSPTGGPLGRGYLKATAMVDPKAWYFEDHFKDDPCMPGTLMFELGSQSLSFYLAALGFTVNRDGWRFQPAQDQPIEVKSRGEINPDTNSVQYEVFVEEVIADPFPTVNATVLGTVDGTPVLLARNFGVQLVPDWPLATNPEVRAISDTEPVAHDDAGFEFGRDSLMACALGKPSDAFGERYASFDESGGRIARLPGPPYHFITRITEINGDIGAAGPGMEVVCEYDIPEDAWYFHANGTGTMPNAVIVEAALQPCGWLGCLIGSPLAIDGDAVFRNLDGTGTLLSEITRSAGTLTTRIKLAKVSQAASMIIQDFEVACFLGDQKVYEMTSVFGFFPARALDVQVGLPLSEHDTKLMQRDSVGPTVDLTKRPPQFCEGELRLADHRLLMLDRVTYFPEHGNNGLGVIRGEKDVDAGEWFFKAHFFQDPVQPGSLGVEALLQLLQYYLLDSNMAADIPDPHFEPIQLGRPPTWKYRGQVTPDNELLTTVMEIIETGHDELGVFAVGNGSLWCDGLRIYEEKNMGMRVVSGPAVVPARSVPTTTRPRAEAPSPTTDGAAAGISEPPPPHVKDMLASLMNLHDVPDSWLGGDIFAGLFNQYVGKVALTNTRDFASLAGRSAIYVANHQVQVESIMSLAILGGLTGQRITAMAHAKHETGWLGRLIGLLQSYPGYASHRHVVYFDQQNPGTMSSILGSLKTELAEREISFFVHAQGTRSRSCRERTTKLSSLFTELAIELDIPIVPVRFTGGLPVAPITGKWEFPIGHGAQDYWIGSPIEAEELDSLALKPRRDRVLDAINGLGVSPETEAPSEIDTEFTRNVAELQQRTGLPIGFAAIRNLLETLENPSEETQRCLSTSVHEPPAPGDTPVGDWLATVHSSLFESK